MQRRGRVQREREQLLGRERAVAVEQLAQRRAFEVLEQQVRERPVEHRVEGADDGRVAEPLERGRLGGEVAQRDRVADVLRAQHLRDQHGQAMVVPDQEHLVALPAAEPAQHGQPRGDRVALLQAPALPRPLPRRRLGDRRERRGRFAHASSSSSGSNDGALPTAAAIG